MNCKKQAIPFALVIYFVIGQLCLVAGASLAMEWEDAAAKQVRIKKGSIAMHSKQRTAEESIKMLPQQIEQNAEQIEAFKDQVNDLEQEANLETAPQANKPTTPSKVHFSKDQPEILGTTTHKPAHPTTAPKSILKKSALLSPRNTTIGLAALAAFALLLFKGYRYYKAQRENADLQSKNSDDLNPNAEYSNPIQTIKE